MICQTSVDNTLRYPQPNQDQLMNERYDFGRNWSELAARFEERHLQQACSDLARLVGDLKGCSFLDVGCGSGLHSAAALKLGASRVFALDYDPDCVATVPRQNLPDILS